MTATDSEVKKYHLSPTDAKNFLELIDLKPEDFDIVYNTDNDNKQSVYVKFPKLTAQHVDLIMKVAMDQLQARINRQKEWDRLKGLK